MVFLKGTRHSVSTIHRVYYGTTKSTLMCIDFCQHASVPHHLLYRDKYSTSVYARGYYGIYSDRKVLFMSVSVSILQI